MLSEETFNRIIEYGIRLHQSESLRFSYIEYKELYDAVLENANPLIIDSETGNELIEYSYLYAMQWAFLAFGILDPDDKSSLDSFQVRNAFYCLFASISNYTLSITHLARSGMDLQASVLLRSLYELIVLLLAVSIDQQTFDKFLECQSVDEATEKWYKDFRIGKLRKIVAPFERIEALSADDLLIEPQSRLYKRLSGFVHHHSTALFVFNYGKTSHPEDFMIPTMLGSPVTRMDETIDLLCSLMEYANSMFHVIFRERKCLLANTFKVRFEQPGPDFECLFNYFLVLADGYHLDVIVRNQRKINNAS